MAMVQLAKRLEQIEMLDVCDNVVAPDCVASPVFLRERPQSSVCKAHRQKRRRSYQSHHKSERRRKRCHHGKGAKQHDCGTDKAVQPALKEHCDVVKFKENPTHQLVFTESLIFSLRQGEDVVMEGLVKLKVGCLRQADIQHLSEKRKNQPCEEKDGEDKDRCVEVRSLSKFWEDVAGHRGQRKPHHTRYADRNKSAAHPKKEEQHACWPLSSQAIENEP